MRQPAARRLSVLLVALFQSIELALLTVLFAVSSCWGVFPYSIITSIIIFGIPLLLAGIAVYGLWNARAYGWGVSIIGNIAIFIGLAISGFNRSRIVIAFVSIQIVSLLLPQSRRFFGFGSDRLDLHL